MVEIGLEGVAVEIGTGAGIGLVAGYVAKKVTKLVAVIAGVVLLAAAWLESRGVIPVNWTGIGNGVVEIGSAAAETAPPVFNAVVSTAGVGGGFVAGFLIGFRHG
ncbi:MAG: FUN14 domain-containing protein [Candidatus Nanohaloarchaea archaeon]